MIKTPKMYSKNLSYIFGAGVQRQRPLSFFPWYLIT